MSSHDYVPNTDKLRDVFGGDKGSPLTERTYAMYIAALLIGQRTPEELIAVADYLISGKISEWRSG